MDEIVLFLNFEGLDDGQVSHLRSLLHPSNFSSDIEFPWSGCNGEKIITKGTSSLNVHAPVFEIYMSNKGFDLATNSPSAEAYIQDSPQMNNVLSISNNSSHYSPIIESSILPSAIPAFSNGPQITPEIFSKCTVFSQPPKPFNGGLGPSPQPSTFKLNPTVSSFVPKSAFSSNYNPPETSIGNGFLAEPSFEEPKSAPPKDSLASGNKPFESIADKPAESKQKTAFENGSKQLNSAKVVSKEESSVVSSEISVNVGTNVSAGRRSWADIVSSGQKPSVKPPVSKTVVENDQNDKVEEKESEVDMLSVDEDKMALALGKHLHELGLDFTPIFLQPRGLINRRNWCYINATLQALLACSPFYTLVRNLPLGPTVERGKSSTPVIDSMVRLTYEFQHQEASQKELQFGSPFQPDFIYDMLRDLKSDCLKGHQEDAEEFLSFILNGMHEEMVKIIKNYEKKNHLTISVETKENGDASDGEDEWQVIGSKHKGMVTRKVAEHKTPISDLLGGQIKSFLTTSGSKTSASIQPFFTLQLDIQSETVTTVAEALKEMTIKEPIQGYTCAKTKQEVEAYSHLSLQKPPPILILHLKRFVYNKTGGCKKVMKKTDYPLQLELSKDIFSSDVKKINQQKTYKLFAVMYHDGEEAIKGHYISDVFNHGCQSWIRCDDGTISAVTEEQVLSHSPPRVPYLLFYQES